jgi:hypothetical protein
MRAFCFGYFAESACDAGFGSTRDDDEDEDDVAGADAADDGGGAAGRWLTTATRSNEVSIRAG